MQPNKDKLKKELTRLAKCNKIDIDLSSFDSDTESVETSDGHLHSVQDITENPPLITSEERGGNFMVLFKVSCLRKYTIAQMIIWYVL